jgi:hypothetical protein
MNWQYEPTLKELFAEEIIQDVMRADHVNPVWLEAFILHMHHLCRLQSLADKKPYQQTAHADTLMSAPCKQ